jgi:hypothetical protein
MEQAPADKDPDNEANNTRKEQFETAHSFWYFEAGGAGC